MRGAREHGITGNKGKKRKRKQESRETYQYRKEKKLKKYTINQRNANIEKDEGEKGTLQDKEI